jgi:hypothetical protein
MKLGNNMKNILKLIAAVSSLLTVLSCNKEIDQPIDQPSEPETYTLSINATKGGDDDTKALSLSGNTLNATWAVGEKVTVYMMVAYPFDPSITMPMEIGTLEPESISSDGTECTLTGELDADTIDDNGGIHSGDGLVLRFSGSEGGSGMMVAPAQDGTLATIQNYYDIATADVTVNAINVGPGGGKVISTSDATFENQKAIVKFTLKDKAGNQITPSSVSIKEETGGLVQDVDLDGDVASNYAANGNCFYFAISGPSGGDFSGDLTITASDGTFDYTYTKTGASFTAGQYYNISVKMQRLVDLSTINSGFEAQDGDILTGELGSNYTLTIADGATVTLNGVTHNAGDYIYGIECLGSATIILAPGSVNDLTRGNNNAYEGIGMTGYDDDYTLTIEGSGTLYVSGGRSAGIGGLDEKNHIVINGGNITATGGDYSAGIGASVGDGRCGNITINGGTVNATGGQYATGIGCGNRASKCGNITFAGGTVTVTNGSGGWGVGDNNDLDNTCGNVYFTGGTVTVWGGISVFNSNGYSSIYVDGEYVGVLIYDTPYYYPAQ